MFNQTPSKLKSIQVSAIMNNKKLSGLVNDALNSAPGSSKREAAASMLKSLNRTSQGMGGAFDGQGGAPFSMQGGQMMYDPRGTQQIAQQPAGTAQALQPAAPTVRQAGIPSVSGVPIAEYPPETPIRPQVIQPPMVKRREPATTPVTPTGVPTAPVQQPEAVPTGDYYDQWYQSLPQEQQAKNKPLLDALKLGLGKKTFAYNELESERFGTLAEEKQKLEDSLREKYELDTLKRNMNELEERGITIEDNLTEYITNRDQYIEKLDAMINTAQQSMATKSNMDDPYVKKMAQNYLNYLHILAGSQQMRYANALEMGINQHDMELKRAQNSFNDASTLFERELRSGIEVTEDEYDRLFDILSGMYENVESREEEELKMTKLRSEAIIARKKAADATIGYAGGVVFTEEQKKEITALERTFGIEPLTDEIRESILRLLTPTQRNKFMLALGKELASNPNLDISTFLTSWIEKNATGTSGSSLYDNWKRQQGIEEEETEE